MLSSIFIMVVGCNGAGTDSDASTDSVTVHSDTQDTSPDDSDSTLPDDTGDRA